MLRLSWPSAAMACVLTSFGTPAYAYICEALPANPSGDGAERRVTAEDLASLRDISAATLSPDGARIAFEVRAPDPASNSYCMAIFVQGVRAEEPPRPLDAGTEVITLRFRNFGLINYPGGTPVSSTPKWSPDGRSIAYLKNVGGIVQLWTVEPDAMGAPRPAAAATTNIENFTWTDDSSGLVFASRPILVQLDESNEKEGLRGYLYDERFAPEVSHQPMTRDPTRQYDMVDLATGGVRTASAAEVAALNGSAPPSIEGAEIWAASPSNDLAWTSRPASQNSASGLSASRNGRQHICLAAECLDGIRSIWWSKDGAEVQFLRREGWARSLTAVYRWRPGDLTPTQVLQTSDLIEDCTPADYELICVFETSVLPRRVVAISESTGDLRTIFDPNPEFSQITLQPAQRLHWRNSVGLEAFGDLVLPAQLESASTYPLIIVGYRTRGFLRGGVGDEYPIQLFAANGYAVLSFDRPIDTSEIAPAQDRLGNLAASVGNWADRRSVHSALEEGIDLALRTGNIDPGRIGLTGFSDGESTAQWALINGPRFAAASLSSLASQPSYVATSGPVRAEMFRRAGMKGIADPGSRAFWGEATIAANPESITAPILVQVSDDEFIGGLVGYEALRELGRPVEMYVFPNEHHVKWQPAHRLAAYRRNLQWFDFWLRDREDAQPLDPRQYERWRSMKAAQPDRD